MENLTMSERVLFLSSLGLYSDHIQILMANYQDPIGAIENNAIDETGRLKDKILKAYKSRKDDFEKYIDFMDKKNISYMTIYDKNYPDQLRTIKNPPMILYYKGRVDFTRPIISFVGARKCTEYGAWACKTLVEGLADYGVTIASGLALGIDRISHEAALDCGLFTMGVLGCGVDKIYPASNKKVFERMEEEGGIISEFPLSTGPLPHNFPIRNRIISGLSRALVVIEAKEKSGTLITANYAADQGRDVFALPGNINSLFSHGTNKLIKDGAKLISSAQDIIDEYEDLEKVKKAADKIYMDMAVLDPIEKKIYESILAQARDTDELARILQMPVQELMSRLTMLEIRGMVAHMDGTWQVI